MALNDDRRGRSRQTALAIADLISETIRCGLHGAERRESAVWIVGVGAVGIHHEESARRQRDRAPWYQGCAVDERNGQRVGIAAAIMIVADDVAANRCVLSDRVRVGDRDRWRVADGECHRCRGDPAVAIVGHNKNRVDAIVGRSALRGRCRRRSRKRACRCVECHASRQRARDRQRQRVGVVWIFEKSFNSQRRDRGAIETRLRRYDVVGICGRRPGVGRVDDDRSIILTVDRDGRGCGCKAALAVTHLVGECIRCALTKP